MSFSYEIAPGPVIRIWDNANKDGSPVLEQSRHPLGFNWPSSAVAEAWVKENYTFDFDGQVAIESTEEGTSEIIEETAE